MRIYAIVLEKFQKLDKDCFNTLPRISNNPLGSWATLGHFDAMYAYKLDLKQQSLFTAIDKHNKELDKYGCPGSFIHPLYLIPEKKEDEKKEDKFWTSQMPYWAVARIHFSDSVKINEKRQNIVNRLAKNDQKGCVYKFYKTVELSDMVLVVHSNRISDLLHFVLTLRKIGEIGRVYTYCGIRIEHLKNDRWNPEPEDRIDYFSMRFTVTDYSQFIDQLDKINGLLNLQNWHSVVGVDDVIITAPNLSVRLLVGLYRYWFFNDSGTNENWGEGISGVTTRVGITLKNGTLFVCEYEGQEDKRQEGWKALKKACKKQYDILQEIDRLYSPFSEATPSWLQPLKELINNLIRISESVVLDEFVYLLLPGVSAFLQNTLEKIKVNKVNNLYCYLFVESCTHLTEHIMRSEGQLTHQPELRPMIYDISIAMLEYTLAFLEKVAEVLQKSDDPQQRVAFLLVPRLCERLKTKELYPAHTSVTMTGAEQVPGLLLVRFPIDNLCKPDKVLMALCHELSHFVGENNRNRLKRTEFFRKAAASVLAHAMFRTSVNPVVEAIEDALNIFVSSGNAQKMWDEAGGWIQKYHENQEFRADFLRNVVKKASITKEWVQISPEIIHTNNGICFNANEIIGDVCVLFRECYADLCMLTLLPITSKEYFNSMAKEASKGKNEQFAIRVCVSLFAKNYTDDRDNNLRKQHELLQELSDCECKELYNECVRIQTGLETCTEEGERLIPISAIKLLLEYTQVCFASLKSLPSIGESKENIKQIFNNVRSNNLDYDFFLETIDQYRLKSLGLQGESGN